MCTVLRTTIVSYSTVKVWCQLFKNKDYDIREAEQSGQPTDVDESHQRELVEEN